MNEELPNGLVDVGTGGTCFGFVHLNNFATLRKPHIHQDILDDSATLWKPLCHTPVM